MRDLTGQVAFITGGTSGIGLGIARAFIDAGIKVAVSYRCDEQLQRAWEYFHGSERHVHAIQLDVTDRDGMERAAEEVERVFGRVHILCNNAAVGITVPVAEASFGDWDWALAVNVGGVINGIQSFLPRIRAHGEGGHILSTASMGGLFIGGNVGIYNTTKFAVVGLMEALRSDIADSNIGVSVLCPGLVDTDIHLSELKRPARYARSGRALDQSTHAARAALFKHNVLSLGMDSLDVGRCVLHGLRHNHLYILTHPEYEAGLRERFEALLAAMPDESPAPAQRVRAEENVIRNAIYSEERDRRLSEPKPGR